MTQKYIKVYPTTYDIGKMPIVVEDADGLNGVSIEFSRKAIFDQINVKDFGAVGDGVADDTEILQSAIDYCVENNKVLDFSSFNYLITAKLNINSGLYIKSSNSNLLKNFDGVGLEFTNGSDTVFIEGKLNIIGYGEYAGDGSEASFSEGAHGVEIINSRINLLGSLWSMNHQGNGVQFTATVGGNGNKSSFNDLRSINNNGYGIRFSGTNDNQSVWKVNFYTQNNYNGGIYIDDDYTGRQWSGFIYNESSVNDGSSNGVYLGKLRSSSLFIYSEEHSTSGMELLIDTNCSDLVIFDSRANTTVNNASASCVTFVGGSQWLRGTAPYMGRIVAPNLNDINDVATKEFLGASSTVIAREKIRGDGALQWEAIQYGGTQQYNKRIQYNHEDNENFGGAVQQWNYTANGSSAVPTAKNISDVAYQKFTILYTGSAYHTTAEEQYLITSVGSGNKASVDILYKLTPNGSSSRAEVFRIMNGGDIKLSTAGKGIIVVSPDGNTTKRIGIDNSGNISITNL